MPWVDPSITLRWGPYSKPDPDEQTAIVTLTQAALGGGPTGGKPLITKRMAVEKIADIFGIEDIDAALETLEAEQEEADQKAAESAATLAAATSQEQAAASPQKKSPPSSATKP